MFKVPISKLMAMNMYKETRATKTAETAVCEYNKPL